MIRLGKQKEMEEDDEEREREKSLKREELWNGERRESLGREWRDEKERKAYKHMFVRKRGEGREHIQVTSERMEGVSLCVYCVHHYSVYCTAPLQCILVHHFSVYYGHSL